MIKCQNYNRESETQHSGSRQIHQQDFLLNL